MSSIILAGEQQRQHAISVINALDLASRRWVVEVKPCKKSRSNPQLALYWKWLKIIGDETGNDTDDLHAVLKEKFLEPELVEVLGTQVSLYSTRGDAKRMTDYMNRVLAFANSQLGIFLPLPEDAHNTGR